MHSEKKLVVMVNELVDAFKMHAKRNVPEDHKVLVESEAEALETLHALHKQAKSNPDFQKLAEALRDGVAYFETRRKLSDG